MKQDGPSIGDNVGNAIYARSHNGIVYDGAVRDINGLKELENFISFVRSYDPSHHFGTLGPRLNSTMIGINIPIRIGKATVMPGDVVLGRDGGVLFIPPQLAEKVVKTSEYVHLRDMFGHLRLKEGSTPPARSIRSGPIRSNAISGSGCRTTRTSCRSPRSRCWKSSRNGAVKGIGIQALSAAG